ncbi:MAG TPA: hypothetical protein VJ085_03365 [Candidatus Acidoferrales bacterium]|nr:hypothetical protein [Candidatus Acidoferrales bacterium]
MFCRFAAATAVASALVAIADLVVVVVVPVPLEGFAPILALWCMLPLVWGLWAMVAPRAWVPERLPVWGTILGVLAGALAMFALNLPSRMAGVAVPVGYRALGLVLLIFFYYLLWMLVRSGYRALAE